jgi:hypothetical protein
MKNWFSNRFGKKEALVKIDSWRTQHSIFQFLSSHIGPDGKLTKEASDLPGENRDDGKLKFAAGLADTLFGENKSEESKKQIGELCIHLKQVSLDGDPASQEAFYRLITGPESVIGIIDDFLHAVGNESLLIESHLFSFAYELATKTAHKNAVKIGVALLGVCQNNSVLEDLKLLGRHDEFTIFTTLGIINLSDDPVAELWDLARKVDGWGRIQIVDRLVHMKLPEDLRDWLLSEGYKNNIMYEYLAYSCAIEGGLHEKLEAPVISRGLFKSAGEIISALLAGGPREDINGYEYAASAIENYARHALVHAEQSDDFVKLHQLKDFLVEIQNDIGDHAENGWTEDNISNTIIDIMKVLTGKDWKAVVMEDLKSGDETVYWNSKRAAEILGIDVWDAVWERLQKNPTDHTAWYDVAQNASPAHAEEVVRFALVHLPLQEITTGPKDMMGWGANYSLSSALDNILGFLENYPKKGELLVVSALKSSITRNRNMAIRVLDKWGRGNWSEEIAREINYLKDVEPNIDTKEDIEKLLKGEALKK